MRVKEIRCKTILNKSGIPSVDYAINPYVGCAHKCQYCYAVFMKRFTGHMEPWGEFVDVKINAPEILVHQLKRLTGKSHISLGTVCDPYQPLEEKYRTTRQCLRVLGYYEHSVSILTKSDLVMRDMDLLKKIRNIEVGFTITTIDSNISKIFEPRAPSPEKRLDAIKTLSQNQIQTWVFIAPLLPYLTDTEDSIKHIFRKSQEMGANCLQFDTLNPYPKVWNNIIKIVKKYFPDALDFYDYYYHNKTRCENVLREKISKMAKSYVIKASCVF